MSKTPSSQIWRPITAFVGLVAAFFIPKLVVGTIVSAWASISSTSVDQLANSAVVIFIQVLLVAILTIGILSVIAQPYGGLRKHLRFDRPDKKTLALVGAAFGYYLIATFAASYLLQAFELVKNIPEQEVGIGAGEGAGALVLHFFRLVVVAAVYEEILFRGFLFKSFLAEYGFAVAAVVTSLLFGLAHGDFIIGVDTFLMGMAAAWLVYRSGSVVPAILLHAVKNSLAFAILVLS